MLYNVTVVCLWDDAAGCRPALAGNCSGPALLDRATGSTSHRWTIAEQGKTPKGFRGVTYILFCVEDARRGDSHLWLRERKN